MFAHVPLLILGPENKEYQPVLDKALVEGHELVYFDEAEAFLHYLERGEELGLLLLDETMIPDTVAFFQKMSKKYPSQHVPVLLLVYDETRLERYNNLFEFLLDIILLPVSSLELLSRLKTALKLRERIIALERKQEEIEIMVEEKNRELQIIKTASLSAQKVKNSMFSNISHEFRTPLTHILGYARLLLYEDLSLQPFLFEGLSTILNSAEKLSELINDIMDFTAVENGELVLENRPFAIKDFLMTIDELAKKMLKDIPSKITFSIRSSIHLPEYVTADVSKLFQVMRNLLSNAVKFTEQGEILIRIGGEEGCLTFEVMDTGIGIGEGDLVHIEKDFVQLDALDTRKYDGLGLGLSICRRLLKLMGGQMRIKSELGKGTQVLITVPYQEVPDNGVNGEISAPFYREEGGEFHSSNPPL